MTPEDSSMDSQQTIKHIDKMCRASDRYTKLLIQYLKAKSVPPEHITKLKSLQEQQEAILGTLKEREDTFLP